MDNINVTIIEDDKLDVTVDTGITLYGTFDIASTETGLPGTEANVENIGTTNNAILKFTIPQGSKGDKGEKGDTGGGIPTGGTTGQVLSKSSDEDYDTEWVDQTSGGGGTSNYNVLTNKPQINSVELTGNKTLDDLGIQEKGSYITIETDPTVPAWAKEDAKPSYTYNEIIDTPTLSTVATSGDYEDLSNKPVLADVATSGSYNDLEDTPIIPTLSTVATTGEYSDLLNKPELSNVATSGSYSDLINTPTLSTVAITGSYEDLLNKPTLSVVSTTGSYNDLENKPSLSVVATSGNYNDLSNTPTSLPANGGNADTVNNIHIVNLTQEEYDALVTKDASTLYLIIE